MEPIRVLIADDHAHFREGLRALLLSTEGVDVVGEATDGEQTISLAARLQPDVIMMDLKMPRVGGIEATRRITRHSPHIGILVLSMFDDDDSLFAALQAGARGYLLKGALKTEILRAVRAVASGDAIFGPGMAKRLISYFSATRARPPAEEFPELTAREREILALIAQHLTNPEIARRLQLSPKTIRNHVSNVFAKLQVADRAHAIIRAHEAGLGGG